MPCRNSSAFPLQAMVETPLYIWWVTQWTEGNTLDFLLSWTGQRNLLKKNVDDYTVHTDTSENIHWLFTGVIYTGVSILLELWRHDRLQCPRCLYPKISATLFVMPAQYLHQDFSDARPASAMCFGAQCENPTLSSHFQWYNSSHWELVWKTQLFFSITWMSYILSINRRVQYTFPKLQNLSYHTLPVVWNRSYKNQAVFKKKKKSSTEQELFAVLKYLPDWSNYCSAWT